MDRVQKFYDDQVKLLVSNVKQSKICGEIGSLRTWLQKHQNDVIPDGAKTQLFTIIEKYNRAAGYFTDIRDAAEQLLGDYLQMPEGKLVSAGSKRKVIVWLENIRSNTDDTDSKSSTMPVASSITKWSVEALDEGKKTVTLLNMEDAELWKEDFHIGHSTMWHDILAANGKGSTITLDIDEGNDSVVKIDIVTT
ncbi:hypothetical protein EON65_24235 [archaeon]|nr:MAG: hypothetical protein EON65_24235 [archaeon]